ncbi:MAG TPA: hypothetical protein VKB45_00775 [Gemmatimonadales bacterium]|nr:hypothetical protein [Gemmatimonadales bacterium]
MTFSAGRLLGLISGVLVGILVYRYLQRSRPVSDADLAKASTEINRRLPIMVDSETQLVSTSGMNHVLQYNYRLVNLAVTQDQASALLNYERPRIRNFACSTPATRNTFLKRGITLHYAYTDRNGYDLFMIEVAPKDCGF